MHANRTSRRKFGNNLLSGALLLLAFQAVSAFGQTTTQTVDGVQDHGTFEVHEYERINLADLSTTITIPILEKKGPIQFRYALEQ